MPVGQTGGEELGCSLACSCWKRAFCTAACTVSCNMHNRLSLKGVSTGDGTEPTTGGRVERSWRLKRSSKEGEPSSIDENC